MPSDSNQSLGSAKNKSFVSETGIGTSSPVERFRVPNRLREVGLDHRRFIPLQEGSKAPVTHDNYHLSEIDENYGVYAGDGLVLLDIDDYGDSEIPEWIDDLPPTFTVRTPHGGTHRYYRFEEAVENSSMECIEIRAENQYVVGPGSELDSCNKGWHDCSECGEGRYEVLHDRPIADIHSDQLPDSTTREPDSLALETVADASDEFPFDLPSRIEKAKTSKKRERFTALWEGRYADLGYSDRSNPEMELVNRLAFWLEKNEAAIRRAMNLSCREHPQTRGGEPRKWGECPGLYRDLTVQSALEMVDTVYEGGSSVFLPDARPEVSYVTKNKVYRALWDLECARTAELVEHSEIDRGERQIRNALGELEEDNLVNWTREGRRIYYYPSVLEGSI